MADSEHQRATWLKLIVLVAFGIGIAMSEALWFVPREYPMSPFPGFPAWMNFSLPPWMKLGLPIVALLSFWRPLARAANGGLLTLLILLILADQNRLQPWVYQYGALLILIVVRDKYFLWSARLATCCVYIWAGLLKINFRFAANLFPWFIGPFHLGLTGWPLYALALSAAFIEMSAGFLLLLPRTRTVGLTLAILTHVCALAALGPWGLNTNSVVWPWNLALIAIDALLFYREPTFSVRRFRFAPSPVIVAITFGLLPALVLVGAWDQNLSFKIYSGTLSNAFVETPDQKLDLSQAAMDELNVPMYPERRVFISTFVQLCERSRDPLHMTLEIRSPSAMIDGKNTRERLSCEQAKLGSRLR